MTDAHSVKKYGQVHKSDWRGNWSPEVARNLILRYSNEGDVLLDPMIGGGTTAIEAKILCLSFKRCNIMHMVTINPYINFNGNAEEAFTFYKSVFGGEFVDITRFKDIASEAFPVSENEANKIMRIALPIGNNVLIANDVPESMGRVSENENRSKIAISIESREEAERIFGGLSAGGAVEMPMAESPWGTSFAMFRDKYGIEWTVEFAPKK